MKNILSVVVIVILPIIISGCGKKKAATEKVQEQTAQEESGSIIEQNQNISESVEVPLSQEEDVIRLFFSLIGEKKIPEAVAMMNPALYPDDAAKQEWGVQFNIFESIELKSVEPFSLGDESENDKTFKVFLNAKIKPGLAQNAPIPDYGWENGESIRWICLEKISGVWKISCVSTGP